MAGRHRGHDAGARHLRRVPAAPRAAASSQLAWWEPCGGTATAAREQIEELVELRAQADVGRFRATSVKIMQDGIVENFTAAMLDPYLDANGRATDNRGISLRGARLR